MKNLIRAVIRKIDHIRTIHSELKEKKNHQKSKPKTTDTKQKNSEISEQRIQIDIPPLVILKTLFILSIFLIASELIVQLQTILMTTLICGFLAIGITPIVQSLEKKHIPRPIAILLLYLFFFGAITVLFFSIIPVIIDQITPILKDISKLFGKDITLHTTTQNLFRDMQNFELTGLFNGDYSHIIQNIQDYFQDVMGATFNILSNLFEGIFNVILALVLLFFMLLERETLSHSILSFFSHHKQDYIIQKTARIQDKMARWFRGQFILMISVGTFMYIGMKIFEYAFGMKYAATIGLLSAFMELFPYIGVFITGIFTLLIAYNISWTLVILILFWIALVQFLEGNILVPLVMEKVTGLSSVVVMVALAIGGTLGHVAGGVPLSILGMIFSVPVAASIAIFLEEYIQKKQSYPDTDA